MNLSKYLNHCTYIYFIGTGTFGRVVLCRHHGTPLALKILSMVDVIRLKQVEHVRNEITVLKEVNHPFIVNMYVYYIIFIIISNNKYYHKTLRFLIPN